jgi:hypothetical protein
MRTHYYTPNQRAHTHVQHTDKKTDTLWIIKQVGSQDGRHKL